MASTTANLHLKLLGTSLQDKETYFEVWRQTLNGEMDDSNMQLIDAAYGDMAGDINDLGDAIQEVKDDAISNDEIDNIIENIFDDN